jgi:antitoxin (DNA-binding transcriptional repressor) of toxin-antitoxin stability system
MIETMVSIHEAARSLSDLVERLRARGEAAVLARGGHPLARIVPVPSAADDLLTFLKRWQIEHPEADEDLGEAIGQSRRTIQTPRDPWE